MHHDLSISLSIYLSIHTHISIYVYVYLSIYLYSNRHTHTHIHTHTHTLRDSGRQCQRVCHQRHTSYSRIRDTHVTAWGLGSVAPMPTRLAIGAGAASAAVNLLTSASVPHPRCRGGVRVRRALSRPLLPSRVARWFSRERSRPPRPGLRERWRRGDQRDQLALCEGLSRHQSEPRLSLLGGDRLLTSSR